MREGHADVIGPRRSAAILNAGWELLFDDKAITDTTFQTLKARSGITTENTRLPNTPLYRRIPR